MIETQNKTDERISLEDAAGVVYLDGKNMQVYEKNGFPAARITVKDSSGESRETDYQRVWLHLSFPLDLPKEFISVQNKDQEEIGLIRTLDSFDAPSREILEKELSRKYYIPKVKKINSLREIRGFSYWKTETDAGELQFTLRDTYRSLRKSEDMLFITDICGNIYVVESLAALDSRSRKKLEIYL